MSRDIYDEIVTQLAKNPGQIFEAWQEPCSYSAAVNKWAHTLFRYASPNGKSIDEAGRRIGCLTQIRSSASDDLETSRHKAWTPELTKKIAEDDRIPEDIGDFEKEVAILPHAERVRRLNVFAEWQRRIDKELDRDPEAFVASLNAEGQ